MKPAALFLAASAVCATCVHAQDELASDRPDLVESSQVVGKGRIQLETGLLLERDRNGEGRERTL